METVLNKSPAAQAGVICNCVRHAILSAPDTFAYAIVSGAMQKASGGHVHDCTCTCMCARISEPACTEPIYAARIFTVFYDCGEYPTAKHFPCHS